ncbi:hypothetical protein EOM09_00285 [bacterium]|nr:hypothetical protein [bacterium]
MNKKVNINKILDIILSPDSSKFRDDLFDNYNTSDEDVFIINSNFKKFFSGEITFQNFLKDCSDFNIKLIEEYLDFHLKLIEEYLDDDYNSLMKDFSSFIISESAFNNDNNSENNENFSEIKEIEEKTENLKDDSNLYKSGEIINILENNKDINNNIQKQASSSIFENTETKTEKYASEIRKIIEEEINQDFLLGAKNINKELTDGVFNPFDDPSLIVDEVVNVIGLRFKNEENRDKFYSILIKYLKNIRNKYQSYEVLIDNKIGLSVSKIAAEKILNLTEKIKKQKENNLLEYKKTKLIQKEKKEFVNNILDFKTSNISKNENKKIDVDGLKTEEDIFHFYDGNIEDLYIKRENERSQEINMDMDIGGDIHRDFLSNKLVGPVEELAYFTILDFRNLGVNIDERIDKLKQKINVLEEYGLNKKILGIKAWLNSEVSEIYKAILNESIDSGSIEDAIINRKQKGLQYLSKEEINKIAELNREFRI